MSRWAPSSRASIMCSSLTGMTSAATRRRRNSASRRRPLSRRRSWKSAPTMSPPSSANRSRAPAACSSRPSTYWPEVQRICRKYGVLIISDEVICGFGRTGNWWGFQSLGFEPDIVPMAKGLSSGYLPIGAVAFADHLIKDFFELGGEFYHGMTYAGHPVAAAVALKNIEIIEQEKLVERVPRARPLFRRGPGLAARPSDRGRDPVHGPHRRHRAVQQQGQAQPLQGVRAGSAPCAATTASRMA